MNSTSILDIQNIGSYLNFVLVFAFQKQNAKIISHIIRELLDVYCILHNQDMSKPSKYCLTCEKKTN